MPTIPINHLSYCYYSLLHPTWPNFFLTPNPWKCYFWVRPTDNIINTGKNRENKIIRTANFGLKTVAMRKWRVRSVAGGCRDEDFKVSSLRNSIIAESKTSIRWTYSGKKCWVCRCEDAELRAGWKETNTKTNEKMNRCDEKGPLKGWFETGGISK